MNPDIFSYILAEEAAFDTDEIQVGTNWNWNFKKHVQLIFHLKNGVFFTGANNWMRAFKNIMEPILNLSYWAEDIELKDVLFYIEDSPRILSFLIKKYHDEVYVKENNLDTLFDEITESDLDYGGALVQKTNKARPEVLKLTTVAFCDQTDILGGPLGFKYFFSPDKLRGMSKFGWGDEKNGATVSLEELIVLAQPEKSAAGQSKGKQNKTTGKNIEAFIVRGNLPEAYLLDNDNMEDFYNQVQIVGFYTNKNKEKKGVVLYRKKEAEGNIKFHTSKEVDMRALGRGVGEGLLHPQIWTNFLEIHKMALLEAGSKIIPYTDDENFGDKSKINDLENLEMLKISDGKKIGLVPTLGAANIQLYATSINEWYEQAQFVGSAFDPILGKEATSGTTFRGQERSVAQGRGLHDRRRGQRAKFIEELYRDYIIPDMVKEILNGKKFLATLSAEEMMWVSEQMSDCWAYEQQVNDILDGKIPVPKDVLKQRFKEELVKQGNKFLLEILRNEFKDVAVRMGINVAGKQKDLVNLSDKLLSIFQFIFANPTGFQQAMQNPGLAKSFNDILEFSGISQVDFTSLLSAPPQAPQPVQTPQPTQAPQPLLNAPQPVQ